MLLLTRIRAREGRLKGHGPHLQIVQRVVDLSFLNAGTSAGHSEPLEEIGVVAPVLRLLKRNGSLRFQIPLGWLDSLALRFQIFEAQQKLIHAFVATDLQPSSVESEY
jgi:hypothetical protein